MPRVWDICPLISPREGDQVLQPVQVLWICDFAIVGGDQHDLLDGELLFPPILGGGSPTEDGGDSVGGVLVSKAHILPPSSVFAVICFIVIAPWPLRIFHAESPVCLVPL